MDGFEQAFASVEETATAAADSASGLARLARRLEKVAKEGNIRAIKRAQVELGNAVEGVQQTVDVATRSWPFSEQDEQQRFSEGYIDELRRVASEQGLKVYERDGRLIVSPSIVRLLLSERAVRIDRKRTSSIRPSALVSLLLENQKKPGAYKSDAFLESLHRVYRELTRDDPASERLMSGTGRVVPLTRVYGLLTSLPGSDREYNRTDFARDLYLLERNGVLTTRSGATVAFPSSTGARNPRAQDLFTFVDSEGRDVQYYGIRFTGGG